MSVTTRTILGLTTGLLASTTLVSVAMADDIRFWTTA